ncbi:hypothetical protein BCT47_23005 [Vibrio splendidus]|uniref:Uncharacterized protein n=2 Tax=Vibrio TaxID=662 RepID=A0AA87C3S1_9VIBR|nr:MULTISPECIES: hypothetical protein [Vibrio]CAK2480069.1 conserved hypothetical protein [Vibrio crassostreae]MDH5933263.1 hypothetical protein [Vibrio splendidus]OEE56250.1 hypothetical protein A146_03675 [Vibrio splendidus FF-500]PMG61045.1 hypothetical protein BCU89_25975 [Vibrio splendidus]PMJ38494.1 hypothetical protein BCU24_20680 [Vibrio cyclitrophicus]
METPMHSINIDFTHSSEAKLLHRLIESQLSPSIGSEEDSYLSVVLGQFEEAIELLESLEV